MMKPRADDQSAPSEIRPVLVVGAGPTGLTAALELSRLKVPVRLIERRVAPAPTSRVLAVQGRTLELLQQRGLPAAKLRSDSRGRATVIHEPAGPLAGGQLPTAASHCLLLSQAAAERLLREQVRCQGVAVEWDTELISFEQAEGVLNGEDGGVRATLRHPDGRAELLEAAYLINTEGTPSNGRHARSLPAGSRAPHQHYALADFYLDGDLPSGELAIFLGRQGELTVLPMRDQPFPLPAADLVTPGSAVTPPELPRLDPANQARDLAWRDHLPGNSHRAATLAVGRVLRAGDAAHRHSPAGGQGLHTGIQDMIDLGWKLALVWHGRATPALLATYAQDRLLTPGDVPAPERTLDAFAPTSLLMRQLSRRGLPGLPAEQPRGSAPFSEAAAHYRQSELSRTSQASGRLRGGDQLPDLLVQAHTGAAPDQLYDLLDPSCFTLLATGQPSALPANWLQQLRPWLPLLDVHELSSPELAFAEAFGAKPGLVLVRPDAYAALVTGPDGWPALLAWLNRWLPVD